MEPQDPRHEPLEWLDDERPPGRLSRVLAKVRLPRWLPPALGALALVAVVTGWAIKADDPSVPAPARPAAEREDRSASPETLVPGARVVGNWEIVGKERVTGGRVGFFSNFYAINRADEARMPEDLTVVARFVNAPGKRMRAGCSAAILSELGAYPRTSLVKPGDSVFVACEDPTTYPRRVPRVDPGSVRIIASTPCEGTGRFGAQPQA